MCVIVRLLVALVMVGSGALWGVADWANWTEWPTDPIYTPYPNATTYPYVLYDANKFNGDGDAYYYKMWHQSPNGIALSYSDDGVNWALNPSQPTGTNLIGNYFHPVVAYDKNGFGGSPYKYKIWLWNGVGSSLIDAILWSVSLDGIIWEQPDVSTQNPLAKLVTGISPGYFYHLYGPGFAIYNKNATSIPGQPYTFPYILFFDTASESPSPGVIGIEQTGLAYSDDGVDWTRYGTVPVLLPTGGSTAWDAGYAYHPSVIKVQGVYHMFYSGGGPSSVQPSGIGYARSFDGLTWTKYSDPVFLYSDGVAWRNVRTYTPSVVTHPDGACSNNQMWFTGANATVRAVGYATVRVCEGGGFVGVVIPNVYLDRTQYVLQATWTKSASPLIVLYKIYKNGVLIGQVSAVDKPYFATCVKSCSDTTGYELVAIDTNGQESYRQPLVVAGGSTTCQRQCCG